MRLGGPTFARYENPGQWIQAVAAKLYRAAYCPVGPEAPDAAVADYARAAQRAGIVIAEAGAWSNPISTDPAVASAARDKCKAMLALAERIGARCCVNIVGSRGAKWDGPDERDLTEETFELIVQVTREIIDAVAPRRTFYTLEPMPWMYPDSADSYERLDRAIDRPAFGVHFDPVNMVCSPQRYFANAELVRDFVARLGPKIKSVHLKDIQLQPNLTTHLDEVRPGLGRMCYRTLLTELSKLPADLPVMLEHLPNEQEYDQAAQFVRKVAAELAVEV